MELLRIIAMVFIVLLHTNAQMMDKNEYPFYLVWYLGIIPVNLYVLVFGWYGIRFNNVKKLCALLFQALFFSLLFLSANSHSGIKSMY